MVQLISGATFIKLYTPSTTASGTVYYYVIVSGTCGTATSTTAAVIVVNATTVITGKPFRSYVLPECNSNRIECNSNRHRSMSYQWYSNTTNSVTTGGTALEVRNGGQTASYTPSTVLQQEQHIIMW